MKKVKNLCQFLCILALFVSFTNCQNDSVSEMQHEEILQKEFPFKTTLLSKQDIATNSKLSNQMRNLKIIQSSDASKSVYNAMHDFTIDTDAVKLIESTENNTHSYTFPIERSQPNGSELENLVFMYDEATDNYSASLVTYHFSQTQLQEFINTGHITSSSYNISYESIDTNIDDILNKNMTVPCTTTYTTYHITPDTNETFLYSTNGVAQNACEHENDDAPCDTYTVIVIDCPDGGGTTGTTHDTGDYSNNTSSSSSTSGGGSSGTTNEPNDNQNEVITSPTKDKLQDFSDILNDVLGEGNWELGQDDNSDDAPNFESAEELEAFLESLENNNFTVESSEFIDLQQSTRRDVHSMHFSSFPSATLRATVKLNTPQTNVPLAASNFLSVRTTVHGSTSFFRWTQYDSEDMSDNTSPQIEIDEANNRLKIKVEGNMEIGFRMFGNYFTSDQSITVELVYNLTTAILISQYSLWYLN
ncbi:hypothetical protein EZY14_005980 [Kordia sp. TARA_039_SRF]|nr:hypothetical protein EZY14_005980 [Kordia sp. TARA_039_SRF]